MSKHNKFRSTDNKKWLMIWLVLWLSCMRTKDTFLDSKEFTFISFISLLFILSLCFDKFQKLLYSKKKGRRKKNSHHSNGCRSFQWIFISNNSKYEFGILWYFQIKWNNSLNCWIIQFIAVFFWHYDFFCGVFSSVLKEKKHEYKQVKYVFF